MQHKSWYSDLCDSNAFPFSLLRRQAVLDLRLGLFSPERPVLLLLCDAVTPWKTRSPQALKHTDLSIFWNVQSFLWECL